MSNARVSASFLYTEDYSVGTMRKLWTKKKEDNVINYINIILKMGDLKDHKEHLVEANPRNCTYHF